MTAKAPSRTSTKVFFSGTHRICPPEATWERVVPRLARFGITRIADVTGLDTIGIPVAMAIRPLAKILSVAQGKGQSLLLAKVSAAMESIEFWHAENAYPPTMCRDTPGNQLHLTYHISELAGIPGSLVGDSTPLDWVLGRGLSTGQVVPIPKDLVWLLSPSERRWMPSGFVRNSNGLASGNSLEEATLHALYEIIERDAVSRLPPQDFGQQIDVSETEGCPCPALVETVRKAGVDLEVFHVSNRFGVPCFAARVWSPDFPVTCIGFGAHLAQDVALSRAITEAAQSRLTVIAGSRDDLPAVYSQVREGAPRPATVTGPDLTWRDIPALSAAPFVDLGAELDWVGATVSDAIGHEALLVDLSTEDDLSVVKVIVPGMKMNFERFHPVG